MEDISFPTQNNDSNSYLGNGYSRYSDHNIINFEDIKPREPQSPEFKKPPQKDLKFNWDLTKETLKLLYSHRLIIIGGKECKRTEKIDFAEFVAFTFSKYLPLDVLKLVYGSELQNLSLVIEHIPKPTIFILPQVRPQDIYFDRVEILKRIHTKHFMIITTDINRETWGINIDDERYIDLESEKLYLKDTLSKLLVWQLDKAKYQLPADLKLYDEFLPNKPFVDSLLIEDIASELRTPDNIALFVRLLRNEKMMPDDDRVGKLIKYVRNNKTEVTKWYYHNLSEREKQLALGLALLNGLHETQFFEALEILVEKLWQKRDPLLKAFDYTDLYNLSDFFFEFNKKDDLNETERIIEIRSHYRSQFLKEGWENQRRLIINTLDELALLLLDTKRNRSRKFGDIGEKKFELFLQVIGETIGYIGLMSFETAEEFLMNRAISDHPAMHWVAAIAIAQWLEGRIDLKIFDFLERWYNNPEEIFEKIKENLADKPQEKRTRVRRNVLLTMALAIGYSAQFYLPNHFPAQLCSLLRRLSRTEAEMGDEVLQEELGNYTIPMVLDYHLKQIYQEGLLYDLLNHPDLAKSISSYLAYRYKINPAIIKKILDNWYEKAQERIKTSSYKETDEMKPKGETLLSLLIVLYGELPLSWEKDQLNPKEVFRRLSLIYEDESYPFVHNKVTQATIRQIDRNFSMVKDELSPFIHSLQFSDINQILKKLIAIHYANKVKHEREKDEEKEKTYILTEIEIEMFQWIKIGDSKLRITALKFLFNIIPEERNYELFGLEIFDDSDYQSGIYIRHIVPYLTTNNLSDREIVRDLLGTMVRLHTDYMEETEYMLEDLWLKIPDKDIQRLARIFQKSIKFVENRAYIYLLLIMLLSLLFLLFLELLK